MHIIALRLFFVVIALTGVLQASTLPKKFKNIVEVQSEQPAASLSARVLSRGRSRGSRPSGPKPSRPKPKAKPKPKSEPKPKPKPIASRVSKPTTTRNSKSTATKAVSTKKPTAAPSVRPKPPPEFPYPSTAFDTCDLYVDCSKDDKDFEVKFNARINSPNVDLRLTKRTRTYPVQVGAKEITIRALDYPSSSELYTTGSGNGLTVHNLGFKDKRIGTTKVIDTRRIPVHYSEYYTEHIIELQSVGMFIKYAIEQQQNLESFFLTGWNKELPQKKIDNRPSKPPITFGKGRRSINALVFEALGSTSNRQDFVLCDRQINAYKESLWSGENPMEAGKPTSKFEKLVQAANLGELPSNEYLSGIRATMAVFDYMNAATVKANLKDSLENVKMELQNVRALTGETANLANMWEAFIRQQMSKMEVHGKKWLNARIKHANTELVKATKKYQMMNAELKGRENVADWNKTKNMERNTFDQQLKEEKAHIMTVGHKITTLEKERDELVRQIQKAKGPAKKPLQDKKNDVKKHLTAAKVDLEAKKRIVGKTQREILELTAAGVQQILRTLQKDKQTLAQYRNSVSALQMPTI